MLRGSVTGVVPFRLGRKVSFVLSKNILTVSILVFIISLFVCPMSTFGGGQTEYKISRIIYKYYLLDTGELLTKDEYIERGRIHWNEIWMAIFAEVEVAGPKGGRMGSGGRLHVLAKVGDRMAVDRDFFLGVFGEETGTYTIPILIYPVLCGELRIRASLKRLDGEGGRTNIGKTEELVLPFMCGE